MDAELMLGTPVQVDMLQDTNVEKILKLTVHGMRKRRMMDRAQKNKLLREHQYLVDHNLESTTKPILREQTEIWEKTRVFWPIGNTAEHERLVTNLVREREFRQHLAELIRYRSLGVTSRDEMVLFKRHVALCKEQMTGDIQNGSQENTNNGSSEEQDIFKKLDTWDVELAPFSWMLSKNELRLCKSLRLKPAQYMTLKYIIIRDNLSTPREGSKTFKVEMNADCLSAKDAVTQYLSHSGWLPGLEIVFSKQNQDSKSHLFNN